MTNLVADHCAATCRHCLAATHLCFHPSRFSLGLLVPKFPGSRSGARIRPRHPEVRPKRV